MRILVFFDLPTTTNKERRDYQAFHKFLLNDGYDMMQLSVYCRICNGEDSVDKHLKRVKQNLPPKGSIRFLQITDRQYSNMRILLGELTKREKKIDVKQLVLF